MPGAYERRAWVPLGPSKGQAGQTLPGSPTISRQQCICNVWLHHGGRKSLVQCSTHQPVKEAWPNVFSTFQGSVVAEAEPSLARPHRRAVHRPTKTIWECTGPVGACKSRYLQERTKPTLTLSPTSTPMSSTSSNQPLGVQRELSLPEQHTELTETF